jgi:hypothetical protein
MYPDNQNLDLFGETVSWPGVDKDGKFTNGSFSDPLVRPSFIPAETINLILDNISNLLASLDKPPNNKDATQMATAIAAAFALKANLNSPSLTGTPKATTAPAGDNSTRIATTAYVNTARLSSWPVGSIYMSVNNTSPANLFGGTWTVWGSGRVPAGIDTSQTEFNTVEKTGGATMHALTEAQMPSHAHSGPSHTHTMSHTHPCGANQNTSNSTYFSKGGSQGSTGDLTTGDSSASSTGSAGSGSTGSAGSGSAHNNLQPYITCYMWKRTV